MESMERSMHNYIEWVEKSIRCDVQWKSYSKNKRKGVETMLRAVMLSTYDMIPIMICWETIVIALFAKKFPMNELKILTCVACKKNILLRLDWPVHSHYIKKIK